MKGNKINDVRLYLVGGAVRDYIMNPDKHPKDFDFSVEADSYEAMENWLLENDFKIFLKTPEYFTIRARRETPWKFADFEMEHETFDFVLARKDAAYKDGRHPESVSKGTLFDDLARRDFTMNAIAIDKFGKFIDPFNGMEDIKNETIRLVGGIERLYEDGLRIIRAIRFQVTLGFIFDVELERALRDVDIVSYFEDTSVNRLRDELYKAFKANTGYTILVLSIYPHIADFIFQETNIWLEPTLKSH